MLDDLLDKLRREYLHVETNPDLDDDQKIERIILSTCAGCAALSAMPLPLADLLILTPIQGYMGWRIAHVRGIELSKQEAVETVKEILGTVGLGLAARQAVITATRLLPGLGSVMSIPLVFGATYGIGRVMDLYFVERKAGRRVPEEALRKAYLDARRMGESLGRRFEKAKTDAAPGSITETFLKEKDAFVAKMREAFDAAYAEFKTAVEDLKPEPPASKPAAKPAAKPAEKPRAKTAKPRESAPRKPARKTATKPVKATAKSPRAKSTTAAKSPTTAKTSSTAPRKPRARKPKSA
ncbi:MAG: hypothetical protein IT350_16830 [Deltaproteobacteria bacterium]|nr:hypothetical protein [Deltaproteobacteria bacterium]